MPYMQVRPCFKHGAFCGAVAGAAPSVTSALLQAARQPSSHGAGAGALPHRVRRGGAAAAAAAAPQRHGGGRAQRLHVGGAGPVAARPGPRRARRLRRGRAAGQLRFAGGARAGRGLLQRPALLQACPPLQTPPVRCLCCSNLRQGMVLQLRMPGSGVQTGPRAAASLRAPPLLPEPESSAAPWRAAWSG
jgi:hypothetical protein